MKVYGTFTLVFVIHPLLVMKSRVMTLLHFFLFSDAEVMPNFYIQYVQKKLIRSHRLQNCYCRKKILMWAGIKNKTVLLLLSPYLTIGSVAFLNCFRSGS